MSVASIEFLFGLLVSSAFYFQLPGRAAKLAVLTGANAVVLYLLIPNLVSLVALALFLVSGYVVALLLARHPSTWLLTGYLAALVAAFLVLKKYEFLSWLLPMYVLEHPIGIIGLSYMLFRQIHFIVDSMQEQIEQPTIWGYLNYQLNLFGILSGPIQRFQDFQEYWRAPCELIEDRHDLLKTILRINVGVIKLVVIGTICFTAYDLAASTLVQAHDGYLAQIGRPMRIAYFIVMFYAFPAYLYFNFSGYCDIVIGGARLIGLKMPENFDRPYIARNMLDYWNRFHRTLSHWIRDYIFMPLYKYTVTRHPTKAEPWSIVFLFVALFLAGVWHGSTLNWVVFGALNGLGVAVVKLWEYILVQWRGRAGLREYLQSRWIRVLAIAVNFNFACLTIMFFPGDMTRVFKAINAILPGT